MKKLYFLALSLLITSLSFGQDVLVNGNFESWDDSTTPTGWTHVENTTQETTETYEGSNSAMQTSSSGTKDLGQLITGIIPGDTYDLTIWYKVAPGGDGTEARIWSKWSNNGSYDSTTDADVLQGPGGGYFDNNGNVWTEYTTSVTAPATANEFYFEVRTYSGSTVYWDNFSFVHQTSSVPSLTITNPTEGAVYNPETTSLDVTFVVQNFTVATAGNGDGHIHYQIDGGSTVMKYDTNPIALSGLTPGAHSVYMELVDDAHQPLDPAVNQTVNYSIAAYTDVANLAELRAGTIGNYYRVTGEVYGTYAQNFRNQKWAQDATAGILIDDNASVISTVYNEGDGVINLRGKLAEYNGTMQIVPSADPGVNSTGNTVAPQMVSIADLTANAEDYESELVQISEAITFADGDGTAVFATGLEYVVNGAADAYNMRTSFYDADYIGSVIPMDAVNLAGIITERSGNTYFITPRDMGSDMVLGFDQQPIEGFSLYPNPVNNGVLRITTQDNLTKNIQIFNILGKQVLATTIEDTTLTVSSLNSGIYIIKVEENNRIATRKLVIE